MAARVIMAKWPSAARAATVAAGEKTLSSPAAKMADRGISVCLVEVLPDRIVFRAVYDLRHPRCPLTFPFRDRLAPETVTYERTIKLTPLEFAETFGFVPLRAGACAGF